jgi:hypothetical protein
MCSRDICELFSNSRQVIDIIVVTKDDVVSLVKTLDSLAEFSDLRQFFNVLIIDASKSCADAVLKCVKSYQSLLQVQLTIQDGLGIFSAMNQGVKLAQADWIQFVNSGDQSINLDRLIGRLLSFDSSSCNGLIGLAEVRDSRENFISIAPYVMPNNPQTLRLLNQRFPALFSICHQSVVFSRSFHLKNAYPVVSIGADQHVVRNLMSDYFCTVDFLISRFYTGGISSSLPNSLSRLKKQLSSAIVMKQYRRILFLSLKYILSFFVSDAGLDSARKWRFKVFAPLIRFLRLLPIK